MRRFLATLVLSVWAGSSLGCAMCNKCGDDAYPFFGGVTPRANQSQGRVGSAFDEAGGYAAASEEGDYLAGEVIEDSADMPEVEELPVPLNDEASEAMPGEPTPAEGVEPEMQEDLPPVTEAPKQVSIPKLRTRRKSINPEGYLP